MLISFRPQSSLPNAKYSQNNHRQTASKHQRITQNSIRPLAIRLVDKDSPVVIVSQPSTNTVIVDMAPVSNDLSTVGDVVKGGQHPQSGPLLMISTGSSQRSWTGKHTSLHHRIAVI